MVTSNKERRRRNRIKALRRKVKAKAKSQPAPSPPKPTPPKAKAAPKAGNRLLPSGVRPDDQVPVFDLDLPARAVEVLLEAKLETKADIRDYLDKHQPLEALRGIGPSWAQKIEKAVK